MSGVTRKVRIPVVISTDGDVTVYGEGTEARTALERHPQAGERLLVLHWVTFELPLPGGALEIKAEVHHD